MRYTKLEPASRDWLQPAQYNPTPETACDGIEARVLSEIEFRSRRSEFLPSCLFADPAWDMLLALYHAELGRIRVTVSNLCVASRVPATTALRWLHVLESHGLIVRKPDHLDGRRIYILLTADAEMALNLCFANDPPLTTDLHSAA